MGLAEVVGEWRPPAEESWSERGARIQTPPPMLSSLRHGFRLISWLWLGNIAEVIWLVIDPMATDVVDPSNIAEWSAAAAKDAAGVFHHRHNRANVLSALDFICIFSLPLFLFRRRICVCVCGLTSSVTIEGLSYWKERERKRERERERGREGCGFPYPSSLLV